MLEINLSKKFLVKNVVTNIVVEMNVFVELLNTV